MTQNDSSLAREREEHEIYMTADPTELPENAFRELAAVERSRPVMHPARESADVTP